MTSHRFIIGERMWEVSSDRPNFSRHWAKDMLRKHFVSEPIFAHVEDITLRHALECESVLLTSARELGCRSVERVSGKLFFRFPYATLEAVWDGRDQCYRLEGCRIDTEPAIAQHFILELLQEKLRPGKNPTDWKFALAIIVITIILFFVTVLLNQQ